MSGYSGYSKSNTAVEAEGLGKFPASVIAKKLGIPTNAVRCLCKPIEWHHTSKMYNATDYYDFEEIQEILATPEGQAIVATARADEKVKKFLAFTGITVEWLEWGGTRRHPRATECRQGGCTIVDSGGKFIIIAFPDGKQMRKGKETKGLKFNDREGWEWFLKTLDW
jgi:hypothetical protein